MQRLINRKIKLRESFRPFAPSVLREHAHEWFEFEEGQDSPYMLLVADVREARRIAGGSDDGTSLLARLQTPRSTIPAVTHVDLSARVQTVDPERHGFYRRVLDHFAKLTGCPILVNTSFNVRGEPIVCTPEDAYRCFMTTEMDALVLEDLVLTKDQKELRR